MTACIEREDEYKIDVLRLLIDKGLDIDRPGWQGMPPLIFALDQGDIDSIKVLLEHGANINTKATIDLNLSFLDMVKDLDNSTKKKIGL